MPRPKASPTSSLPETPLPTCPPALTRHREILRQAEAYLSEYTVEDAIRNGAPELQAFAIRDVVDWYGDFSSLGRAIMEPILTPERHLTSAYLRLALELCESSALIRNDPTSIAILLCRWSALTLLARRAQTTFSSVSRLDQGND